MRLALALLLPLLLALEPSPAHGAQSYDSCTGFIDSLPATITQQGTWCMRADLSTAISTGAALEIATNNVTIDCNHFKLGGLAAGAGTGAVGIYALNRLNATIRNCNVRGFVIGVVFNGSGGHVVEDNRFESNRYRGIEIKGDGNIVRRNQIVDTGGSGIFGTYAAIYSTSGQIVVQDNVVSGVTNVLSTNIAGGILVFGGANSLIQGNHVSGLVGGDSSNLIGLAGLGSTNAVFRDNTVSIVPGGGESSGVVCDGDICRCRDNVLLGTAVGLVGCTDLGRNDHVP